jgi:hypothetical protein
MVISFPAFICLETTWRHILTWTGKKNLKFSEQLSGNDGYDVQASVNSATPEGAAPAGGSGDAHALETSWPSDTAEDAIASGPLTAAERRARAAALRGLTLGRSRRFAAATTAFTEAARLDPTLDLTRTPGFWGLERAGHEAAIAAYVAAGRTGDAVVLRARVQSTYRPKPLRPAKGMLLPS